jgi:hypothetical protein
MGESTIAVFSVTTGVRRLLGADQA